MNLPDNKKKNDSQRRAAADVPARPVGELPHERLNDLRAHEIELEMQNDALRQMQLALEEARDRYVNLYEFAPVGYLILTPEGQIDEINLTGARLLKWDRNSLLHKRFALFVIPQDQDRWERLFLKVQECGEKKTIELALSRGDGTVLQAQLDCVSQRICSEADIDSVAAAGRSTGVSLALIDISERKQAESALFESHETLCSILAATRDGYWHVDSEGVLIDVNAVYSQQSGYTRKELLGMHIHDLETPESAAETAMHIKHIVGTGSGQFESTHRREDGSIWFAEVSVTYRDIEGGEFFFFVRDISERKHADEVLREQKEFFHLIAENISDFIAVLDPKGKRLYNSPSFLQFLGATSDLCGTDSFAEIHPEDRKRVKRVFRETMKTGIGRQLVYRLLKADGSISEMESRGSVIKDGKGRVTRVVVVSHDITKRKLAEKALKESEAFKNVVLNSVAAEIAVIDRAGVIQAVNERWRNFSVENSVEPGHPVSHADIGTNYLAVCEADPSSPSARKARDGIQAVLDGRLPSFSLEYPCHSTRQQRWFSMIVTPLGQDLQHGVTITHTDITALKQAEQYEQFRSRILELLAGGKPLPVILEALVRGVEQIQPAMLCSILMLDSQGQHLGQGVAPSLPDFYNAVIDGIEIGAAVASCGTAAYTGERVIVEDIATHPFWAPYRTLAASAGLGACWSQPIRASTDRVLGTFAIYHRDAHAPTEYDISIIEQSARLASIAIERNLAAEKLKESEAHYRLLTEDVSDVVWKQDCENRFTYISPADEWLRGYRAEEVIGHHVSEFLTAEGVAAFGESVRRRQESEQRGVRTGASTIELQQRCKNGRLIWVEILSTPERDAQGTITGYHGISRNITERKQAEAEIDKVQRLLKETERIGKVGGWEFNMDSGKQTWTEEIYDIHEVGRDFEPSVENGIAFYTPTSRPLIESALRRAIEHGEPFDLELEIITAKGNLRCVHAIGKPDHEQRRVSGFFQDITERKQMEDQVRQLAFYDPLTKLPNRRLLKDRLSLTMAASTRTGCYGAVMFLDLDNFKPLNDSHGHEIGDLLLIEVAARMKSCVREMDTVARVGGDEFVVMISELVADRAESISQVSHIAEKIRIALAQPYLLVVKRDGKAETTVEHQCTASIGVVLFNSHDASQDDIINRADTAMYEAKEAGRNLIRFYAAMA
ncbi:PAS domain S-box protein [Propionivibrio sp.]|uniref:PAS domain S-box protein n=1 Tax=Propionivibrio sp. TaxID=2212460 RepID=UPI0026267760|nr:PAS domain S-box protein [Propionivibrio sp.]